MATSADQHKFLIEKAADQSITNSTTLTNDATLLFAIAANEVWRFTISAPFNVAGATSGFKMSVNGPTAPTNLRWTAFAINGVAVATLAALSANAFATALGFVVANAGDHILEVSGTVENGANAGNVTLQFAQNTLDAVNSVTVRRGALLIAEKIG